MYTGLSARNYTLQAMPHNTKKAYFFFIKIYILRNNSWKP